MESGRYTLEQHTGTNFITKKLVRFPQYDIKIEGEVVARIGFRKDSKICWITNFDPITTREIEDFVRDTLEINDVESSHITFPTDDEQEVLDGGTTNDEDEYLELN